MSSNNVLNTNNSTLSSSFYMSKYYAPNRNAKTASNRKSISNDLLISYDTNALNKFITDIRSINYNATQSNSETNHKNKVSAFVSIYNNFTESAKKSSSLDVTHRANRIMKFTKKQEDELKKIGITINEDSSLTLDTKKLESADISKVKSLFSNSSTYMKEIKSAASKLDIGV
ncbi:MAG: hypothetical protein HDT39_07155 [Lachnospiraceae bacterium]|nr:hypothetical protein [Lachnospiraceae bacterium]